MVYKNEGFPGDLTPFSAADFRSEFNRIGVSFTEFVTADDTLRGGLWTAEETGATSANRYVLTLPSAPNISLAGGYSAGMMVWWKPSAINTTGQVTVSVNDGPAAYIIGADGEDLEPFTLPSNGIVGLVYDGEYWRIVSNALLASGTEEEQPDPTTVADELVFNIPQGGVPLDRWFDTGGSAWRMYDDIGVSIPTSSGVRTAMIGTMHLLKLGAVAPNSPVNNANAINVFGGASMGVDPVVLLGRSTTDNLAVAFSSERDANAGLTMFGRRYGGRVAGEDRATGWTPNVRIERGTNGRLYMVRDGYTAHSYGVPPPDASQKYLLTVTNDGTGLEVPVGLNRDWAAFTPLDVDSFNYVKSISSTNSYIQLTASDLEDHGVISLNWRTIDTPPLTVGLPRTSQATGMRVIYNRGEYPVDILMYRDAPFVGVGTPAYITIPPLQAVLLMLTVGNLDDPASTNAPLLMGIPHHDYSEPPGDWGDSDFDNAVPGYRFNLLPDGGFLQDRWTSVRNIQALGQNIRIFIARKRGISGLEKCVYFMDKSCSDVMFFNDEQSDNEMSIYVASKEALLRETSGSNNGLLQVPLRLPEKYPLVEVPYGALRRVIRSGPDVYTVTTS